MGGIVYGIRSYQTDGKNEAKAHHDCQNSGDDTLLKRYTRTGNGSSMSLYRHEI